MKVQLKHPRYNDKDIELILFCIEPKSIREIAKALKIAPKNVSEKFPKLEKYKIIDVKHSGWGKTSAIQTNKNHQDYKDLKDFLQIKKEVEKKTLNTLKKLLK